VAIGDSRAWEEKHSTGIIDFSAGTWLSGPSSHDWVGGPIRSLLIKIRLRSWGPRGHATYLNNYVPIIVRIVPKNCRIILNVAALSLEVQHPLRRKGVPYELIIILARLRSPP
jgi:hypothetical protein